jgi:hypothetical protein
MRAADRLGDPDRPRRTTRPRAGLLDHRPSDEPGPRRPLDLFAIAGTALIVRSVAADGETTWFEGLSLIGVYSPFVLAYYFESSD